MRCFSNIMFNFALILHLLVDSIINVNFYLQKKIHGNLFCRFNVSS